MQFNSDTLKVCSAIVTFALSTHVALAQVPDTFWPQLEGKWTHMSGDGTDGETFAIDDHGRVAAFTSSGLTGQVMPGAFPGGGNFAFQGETDGQPYVCSYNISFTQSDPNRANFSLVFESGIKFCPSGTYEKTL